MSQFFPPVGGVMAGMITVLAVDSATNAPDWVLLGVGVSAAVLGMALWMRSPLPNSNGIMGMGGPRE